MYTDFYLIQHVMRVAEGMPHNHSDDIHNFFLLSQVLWLTSLGS